MDLAEVVEDLICTLDQGADTTMDTVAMYLFGWLLAALVILWVGKIVYARVASRVAAPAQPEVVKATVAPTTAAAPRETDVPDVAKPVTGRHAVAPTPPTRRRIARQSPAPDPGRKPRYVPAPQCTGPDNVAVLWVNDVFQWLYGDLVIVNELVQHWIQSLNDYATKAADEQGVTVELVRMLPETLPPTLGSVFAECDSKDDVTITCDCEMTPAFQLRVTRQKGEIVDVSHYRVNVNRFRARLNVQCVTDRLQASVKCDGWPEIKVALAPVGNIRSNMDESHLQEVISEILIDSLRNTEVPLNLARYPTCPRLVRHVATSLPGPGSSPHHYDSMNSPAYTSTPNHYGAPASANTSGDRRLLVKVVRAAQLSAGCTEPFCVVEMDEPAQKYQTSVQKHTDSPQWDEHFLFDLSPGTAELLFEVYDHGVKPHRFLGLGIVGVEELLINPSQRQIITLQSRPYESDPVSGTLTVEFLFIEGADIPAVDGIGQPYKIKETIRTPSPSAGTAKLVTTTTVIQNNDHLANGTHLLTEEALRDLDRSRQMANPNKSTLVIHSVHRNPSQRLVKVELSGGSWKEVERIERDLEDETKQPLEETPAIENPKETQANGKTPCEEECVTNDKQPMHQDIRMDTGPNSMPVREWDQSGNEHPSRARKRRDFFGTIKRRLGRSRNGRSKSAGRGEDANGHRDDSLNRSISADRHRMGHEDTSRRSSLSEASGLSSASTRTYINEASTLVLETVENGVRRHYLVPLSLAQKSRWRKKGTKLHIFNDHTFVARHLQGGFVCQVCGKSIARRIGKQGYECRDCLLKCHKHCHVKVNDNCPTSTIHNIELSYITNPITDKNLRLF